MLYSVNDGKFIHYIPYEKAYRIWRGRLTDQEYQAIEDELNRRFDTKQIDTSSWIPGNNWSGTVFDPIYKKACLGDEEESGKCFGLFLWVIIMNRPEAWAFGRYEKNNIPIEGLTYFRVTV